MSKNYKGSEMKLKLAAAILLTSLFFLVVEYSLPQYSIIEAFSTQEKIAPVVVDNVAFTAVKEETTWKITLKPGHFHKQNPAKSFAIIYNDIFYGVFLLTDKIYLPVLADPETEIIISSLDDEGRPLASEYHTL